MLQLKLPFIASLHPNSNGTNRWAEGKTNTSSRPYRGLNSCEIGNLSRICIRVFLHRPEVSHHNLDDLVEDHYCSPYVFVSPTEATKAPALYYPLCVAYVFECVLVLFLIMCFYSRQNRVEMSLVIQ
jgi:hypothetical protein